MQWEDIASYARGLKMKLWAKWYDSIRKPWIIEEKEENKNNDYDLKFIQDAKDEVSEAENIFSRADDPDMVDWAIYNLTAAEKRYNYLIKKYKQKDIQGN